MDEETKKENSRDGKPEMGSNTEILDKRASGLRTPLDIQTKNVLKSYLNENSMDTFWNNFSYYFTWFESLDGWDPEENGSATITLSNSAIVMSTGATSGSSAYISKGPSFQDFLRWDREQRFRTHLRFESVTNVDAWCTFGDGTDGVQDTHYGFHLEDNVLKGTTSHNTSAQEITLVSGVAGSAAYELEARLSPNGAVSFFVDGELKGVLSGANNPTQESDQTTTTFFKIGVKNSAAEIKHLKISYLEYIIERKNLT